MGPSQRPGEEKEGAAMASKATVVTTERFAQGSSYGQYIDGIKVNKARFQEYPFPKDIAGSAGVDLG